MYPNRGQTPQYDTTGLPRFMMWRQAPRRAGWAFYIGYENSLRKGTPAPTNQHTSSPHPSAINHPSFFCCLLCLCLCFARLYCLYAWLCVRLSVSVCACVYQVGLFPLLVIMIVHGRTLAI